MCWIASQAKTVNRRGVPTPNRHAKLLIHLAVEGSCFGAYSHPYQTHDIALRVALAEAFALRRKGRRAPAVDLEVVVGDERTATPALVSSEDLAYGVERSPRRFPTTPTT